jgi:hypothetical protein
MDKFRREVAAHMCLNKRECPLYRPWSGSNCCWWNNAGYCEYKEEFPDVEELMEVESNGL